MRSRGHDERTPAGLDGLKPGRGRSIRRQFGIRLRKKNAELFAGSPEPAFHGADAYPELLSYLHGIGMVAQMAERD